MTRTSAVCGRVISATRAIALLPIVLFASACSPYIYQKEVGLFGKGVDDSIASFEELKQMERERRVAQRNENLKKQGATILTSPECDQLRRKYEAGFKERARNVLTEADYEACQVAPTGQPRVDPLLPNLTAMGEGLRRYAAALGAVTNAEDATQFQSAFTEFNSSVTGLLKAVNQELAEKNRQKFDAIAGLVYQAGIAYLNQRRFNALQKAVNDTHPVIKTAAELMAEGAFSMYGPEISKSEERLDQLQSAAASKTGDDYVRAWQALNAERDMYVELFRKSPVGVFQKLVETHEALRKSVSDPGNTDQIQQVLTNAKAFQASAQTALQAFKKNGKAREAVGGGR